MREESKRKGLRGISNLKFGSSWLSERKKKRVSRRGKKGLPNPEKKEKEHLETSRKSKRGGSPSGRQKELNYTKKTLG